MEITENTLLNGRLRYRQPRLGFRSGIEPIFLAATIPARAGERVLEAGSGAGATLLCLAARVPGITALGIEINPDLVALATSNGAISPLADLHFIAGDITAGPEIGLFHHACANPPYHTSGSTPSPLPARAQAKLAAAGLFAAWIVALASRLRPRGTLSLIVPAAAVPACLEAFRAARCGSVILLPLWPRAGRVAKLVLLRAVRGGRGVFQLLPGLILHDAHGFTPAAQAILRDAAALPLDNQG
ncbi:MAG: methyltransferase domain-containing protein [Acetobacteraceae bacterium]|nr:methyltransferase domain-containing protein [Acetobacteraceae bacterium]